MQAVTVIAQLSLSAVAIIISIWVPRRTFRFALRQDQNRRVFEQRAQLYVDLLTEAYAEKEYWRRSREDAQTCSLKVPTS